MILWHLSKALVYLDELNTTLQLHKGIKSPKSPESFRHWVLTVYDIKEHVAKANVNVVLNTFSGHMGAPFTPHGKFFNVWAQYFEEKWYRSTCNYCQSKGHGEKNEVPSLQGKREGKLWRLASLELNVYEVSVWVEVLSLLLLLLLGQCVHVVLQTHISELVLVIYKNEDRGESETLVISSSTSFLEFAPG